MLSQLSSYQLRFSKRKTLAIEITPKAKVIIRAPINLSSHLIDEFVAKKQDWINAKQAQIKQQYNQVLDYQSRQSTWYLGKEYPIILTKNNEFRFDGQAFYYSNTQSNEFKKQLLYWYKNAFRDIVLLRLDYYARQYHLPFNQVRLKCQKTRWGSCSNQNNINLNYLLIQTPIKVIDYVIVHELSHTIHKNHSKDFYQLVGQIMPDYLVQKKWLKEHAYCLGISLI